jgi:polar amino acid transport system substrate-binding protein
MMKALSEKTGLQFEYTNIAFDPVLAGISSCQYDLAVSAITITDERKQTMLFSDPYIKAGQIVSVLKTNTEIKSKDDLKGKNLGAQLGTTGEIEAKKIEGAKIKSYDSVDLAFLDLKNGQVDAVITDYPTALGFIGQNADIMQTVGEVFTDESYGIAVCKNKTDLLNKVNEGLAALKSDGTLEKLEKKWVQGVK